MTTKKLFFLFAVVIMLAALIPNVRAQEARTLEQRVAELEARVAYLEACLANVCTIGSSQTSGSISTSDTTIVTVEPPVTVTVVPPVTDTPAPTQKEACNQGRGNGAEGCDPGNSNHHNPSNDEGPLNRGGKNVPKPK